MVEAKGIHLVDTSLRDGSHAVSHQFTPEQVANIAGGLDEAGVKYIEVTHGDGLAGASYNYGRPAYSDEDRLKAAAAVIKKGKLTVLLIPGIGTKKDLEAATEYGARAVRVATHCTEADVGEQHIALGKKMGLTTFGFLMMSHMVTPEKLAEQAKLMESYGADVVYVADSAGAMLPKEVHSKISAVASQVQIPVGFHAHNNLSIAVGNSITAIEAGASFIDCCCRGLGAGAGNTQTEVLVGVLDKLNYQTGIDFYSIMEVAEKRVEPIMHRPQVIDNPALMLGYGGVYSSFLLHTFRAADKFKVDPLKILVELGNRKMVGGQEDMIVDVAYELSQKEFKEVRD
ncbi:MAG: 4-hydroxy-2-oxovalerate aldolase [Bacillota bacterium]|nr:4-hydroxy-2-oxovalerate aldolase [Bacillota bacterium]